ncbi:hypothetical protein SAMN05216339_10341 [Nitrosomonas eutropha]|uniref:Uncharacterized protein n=1 Tax=Nitrosomonas eutropha TaxID=916 RepID=A0A1I7GLJ2_9PROT|nr:hypothetical protein [Nitrosomonas eutropha]SFU49304.1 hypothetical protein SAMN05216339_10341 [Nitrosomonas eutropha]
MTQAQQADKIYLGNQRGGTTAHVVEARRRMAAKSFVCLDVLAEAAGRGDIDACKLLLERVIPPVKVQTVTHLVTKDITPETIKIMGSLVKVMENIEHRLAKLEARTK